MNLNANSTNINNYNNNNIQYNKNVIKANVKITILKKDIMQSNTKKISPIANTNVNTYFNFSNNVNSGNSKNGEKNNILYINKFDSASSNSFKIYESPKKNSKIKEYSERKYHKSNSIFEPGHLSPDIRRKKFDLDVSEYKSDFKSKEFF